MKFRPWLEIRVRRQMPGLPDEARDMLVSLMARICEDPYDRVNSMPTGALAWERMAELGDFGYIEFTVDEIAGLIRVNDLVWIG